MARTIAEIMVLPSVLVAVTGYILMVTSLNRVAREENRHVSYPWASRSTIWLFLLGGFGDAAAQANDEDQLEWNRAAAGRLMLIVGVAAFAGSLLMWQLQDWF